RRWLGRILVDGTLAGMLSAAVLAWRGRVENAHAAAPLNAPAHWFFGGESLHRDGVSLRHTLTGFAVHQASSLFWASFHGLLQARRRRSGPADALVDAAAVTAVAAVVDLRLVPERLTPGFEHRLSRASLVGVYVAFALGLSLSAWSRHGAGKAG